ncbi:hypothetical protein Dimus_008176, partial [Dionaea muscipula]
MSLASHCPLRSGLNHAAAAGCEMGCAWAADYDGLQAKLPLASTLYLLLMGCNCTGWKLLAERVMAAIELRCCCKLDRWLQAEPLAIGGLRMMIAAEARWTLGLLLHAVGLASKLHTGRLFLLMSCCAD